MTESGIKRVSGEFVSPKCERDYRAATAQENRRYARFAITVTTALYVLFLLGDYISLGWSDDFAIRAVSRILALCAGGFAIWRLREPLTYSRADMLVALVVMLACISFAVVMVAPRPLGGLSAIIVMTLGIYLVLPTRFAWTLSLGSGASALWLSLWYLVGSPDLPLPASAGLMVVVNGSAALVLGRLNRAHRLHFATVSALRASREELNQLFLSVPVPLSVTRMSDGCLVTANAAAVAVGRRIDATSPGLDFSGLMAGPAGETMLELVRNSGHAAADVEVRLADGAVRHFQATGARLTFQGEESLIVGGVDVTERRRMERELQHLASYDPLTGLINRRHFFQVVRKELARAQRYGRPLAVVIVDLDGAKAINDAHGVDGGDLVLRELAKRCRDNLREVDIVARYGGDDFAIVMPESDLEEGLRLGTRLQEVLSRPVSFDGVEVSVSVSVGVTEIGSDEADMVVALNRAEAALADARSLGRGGVCVRSPLQEA